jgi:hypothetical protein
MSILPLKADILGAWSMSALCHAIRLAAARQTNFQAAHLRGGDMADIGEAGAHRMLLEVFSPLTIGGLSCRHHVACDDGS